MKTESENIQRNISKRLNKLQGSISAQDYQYLWSETHKLYNLSRSYEENDLNRPKKRTIKK
jgi:hypothetical protein